jgi:putative oxidoreductase
VSHLQRLFSNFADGWPGRGLLIQRVITGAALAYFAVVHTGGASGFTILPEFVGAGLGIFVLVGLWTPLVGTLVALVELWIAYSHAGDVWIAILLATLGVTLAMIGPGAWSVDARLFGRKHITSTPNLD